MVLFHWPISPYARQDEWESTLIFEAFVVNEAVWTVHNFGVVTVALIIPLSERLFADFSLEIPTGRDEIIHEVELGVVIGKTGMNISESEAMDHVGGYALALDMTDLDLIFDKVREFMGNIYVVWNIHVRWWICKHVWLDQKMVLVFCLPSLSSLAYRNIFYTCYFVD